MQTPSFLGRAALGLALVVTLVSGCHNIEPPYAPNDAPEVEALLTAAEPPLSSVQVPRAKVRSGASPAASLMLVGQAPARFSGTIQISGNELVTLAVNEDSYGLRWIGAREGADALAPGYYEGPPSRCAVRALLGVDLEPEELVDVVLGGAPLIRGPHEVLDRSWDRKAGRERLKIANDNYEQELSFAWEGGAWHFAGASLWQRTGGEPLWLWTISHEELHEVGGELLPKKTDIRQPKANGRGEQVLHVSYQKQVPNPSLGGELSADPPKEILEGGDGQPANAGDSFDDDWDDEDSWEDGEADDGAAATGAGGQSGGGAGVDAAEPEPVDTIPPQFIGNPTGLTPRGDLCAGY